MKRWIMHVDMDAFFAAVEQRDNEELRGKPVIIGGLSARGVVSTASYEARTFGIHSAMPMAEALRRCPQAVFLPCNHVKYEQVSAEFMEILRTYSPLVEPLSLDEAFLDVSGMDYLYKNIAELGRTIKKEIKKNLNLTVSIGIAPNKFIAKIASDIKKPNGFVVVNHHLVDDFLRNIPIGRLWGVGKVTARILSQLGIYKIGDIIKADDLLLRKYLGQKCAFDLKQLAQGLDNREVHSDYQPKSISNEVTFPEDVADVNEILSELLVLAQKVGFRLRSSNFRGRTITLKVRFACFQTITRSVTLAGATCYDDVIYDEVKNLFCKIKLYEPVRLVGITVSNFVTVDQISLFDNTGDKKRQAVSEAIDKLKLRFGEQVIHRGL